MDFSLIDVARFSTLISRYAPAMSSSASIRPICYGSTTTNDEDVGDDNELLLLKSALDGAYERMRLWGGLLPHINVASLHRLPGSGVPPPYRRFGWSISSSRRYHHRRRRYNRRCRHSAAGAATIDEDHNHHRGIPHLATFVYLVLDSRRILSFDNTITEIFRCIDDNRKLYEIGSDIVARVIYSPNLCSSIDSLYDIYLVI